MLVLPAAKRKRPLASRTAGKPSTASGEADVGARAPVASLRMAMAPPGVYTKGCCNWASAELAKKNNTVKSRQSRPAIKPRETHGDRPRAVCERKGRIGICAF